jgi:hypothetical protein
MCLAHELVPNQAYVDFCHKRSPLGLDIGGKRNYLNPSAISVQNSAFSQGYYCKNWMLIAED